MAERLAQQVELVLAPVGRVGHRQRRSAASPSVAATCVDHPRRDARAMHSSADIGVPPSSSGRGVADAALELAGDPARVGRPPAGRPARPPAGARRCRYTTDGIAWRRVPSWTVSTRPSRAMAAAVQVVPTSIARWYGNGIGVRRGRWRRRPGRTASCAGAGCGRAARPWRGSRPPSISWPWAAPAAREMFSSISVPPRSLQPAWSSWRPGRAPELHPRDLDVVDETAVGDAGRRRA